MFKDPEISTKNISHNDGLNISNNIQDKFGWYFNLNILKTFIEEKGRLPVSTEKYIFNGKEINIGSWLHNQKDSITNNKMKNEKFLQFNEVVNGFELYRDQIWETNLNILNIFIQEKGRVPVSTEKYIFNGKEIKIGSWLNVQRKELKNGNSKSKNQRIQQFMSVTNLNLKIRRDRFFAKQLRIALSLSLKRGQMD